MPTMPHRPFSTRADLKINLSGQHTHKASRIQEGVYCYAKCSTAYMTLRKAGT
jgi:hypothetical protein